MEINPTVGEPAICRRLCLLTLIATLVAGCAATRKPPYDLDLRLQAATSAFGGKFDYLFVKSSGQVADQAFITMSKATGPSDMARALGTRFAQAEKQQVRILVTGPSSPKVAQVIVDALSFHQGRQLPMLEILFLGAPETRAEIEAAARSVGARFAFAPFNI